MGAHVDIFVSWAGNELIETKIWSLDTPGLHFAIYLFTYESTASHCTRYRKNVKEREAHVSLGLSLVISFP